MKRHERIYQSILGQLSLIPVEHLQQIDNYLKQISKQHKQKEQNRANILSLAGAWQDMADEDFEDIILQK